MNREDLLLTDEELDNIGYPILPLGDRSGYKRVAQAQLDKVLKWGKEHPENCQCGNHEAHNIKFDKTKTAGLANTALTEMVDKLTQMKIREAELTQMKIREAEASCRLDSDTMDCTKCKANIRQQLIEEIEKLLNEGREVDYGDVIGFVQYLEVSKKRWQQFKLDYYILFIKPDLQYYQLYKAEKGKYRYYVHLEELIKIA